MIFQDPFASLNPRRTVGQIITAGPIAHGVPGKQARAKAEELLALVGLDPTAYDRYPNAFSGGQRQRVGIARALAMEPDVLVADEAVSALDVSVQAQVLDLLEDLKKRLSLAMMLFITHDLRVAATICDRIAVMHRGAVVEMRPTATSSPRRSTITPVTCWRRCRGRRRRSSPAWQYLSFAKPKQFPSTVPLSSFRLMRGADIEDRRRRTAWHASEVWRGQGRSQPMRHDIEQRPGESDVIPARDEAARVEAMAALGLLGTAPEPHFEAVCRVAKRIFGVAGSFVALMGDEKVWLKTPCELIPTTAPRRQTFCHFTVEKGVPIVARDTWEHPDFKDLAGSGASAASASTPASRSPSSPVCRGHLLPRRYAAP